MHSRKRRWVLVLAGLAVLAAGAFVLWLQPERISQENFDRIRVGMSRAEVEAILGGPPGDYRTVRTVWNSAVEEDPAYCSAVDYRASIIDEKGYSSSSLEGGVWASGVPITGSWFGNEGEIQVDLTPEAVCDKDFLRYDKKEQGLLENLQWRAKRQWRRWFR